MTAVLSIARRELATYFNTPIAYVVLSFYLVASGTLFFIIGGFFIGGTASMRSFFGVSPWLFMVLGPAVTMRLIAEERKSGTLELVMTLPIREWQIVLGKFLGALAMVSVGIAFTGLFAISVSLLVKEGHSFSWGPVIAAYLGLVLMASTFIATGMWASALTRNQIISFIIGMALCFVLVIIDKAAIFFPDMFGSVLIYLSVMHHFENIARGVIDSRDIVYYVSATAVGLWLTAGALKAARQ